jgi:DNA polymerase-4
MSKPRRILHIDMDAFFAAVELKRHPELRGKPVVIGGRGNPSERGVVSTASYEARRFGIHSAMPLRTAHRLCPEAVFLPVDFEAYERESARIKDILREITPQMEDVGIDEAFLDISELPETSETIARTIQARILERTGLTCSIGIAPNKLLAKIASDLEKPSGLTVLQESDLATRIWPLPVRKLPGVGPKTEARLHEMGIDTIGALARTPLQRLIDRFGPSHGRYLRRAAWGEDEEPIVTHWEPKSTSREVTFAHDVTRRRVLVDTLRSLTREVTEHLRSEGYRCRTVTVKIRFSDFETHTRERTLPEPTDRWEIIEAAVLACFARVLVSRPVRLLGVRLGELSRSGKSPEPPSPEP